MITRSRCFLALGCAALVFAIVQTALAAPTFTMGAPGEGVTTDPLNHTNGVRFAGSTRMHDQCCGVSNARAAIGFTSGSFVEPTVATFFDGPGAGTVDSITFMLLNPITATSFDLRLSDDGASNARMASAFSVQASRDGINFTTISSGAIPTYDGVTINDAAPTTVVDAQFFRLNVTRAGTTGVRIREFDVFGPGSTSPHYVINPNLLNATTNTGGDEPAGISTNFTASSAVLGTDTVVDAFGNNDGAVEANTFIFGDGRTPDNNNSTVGDGGESVDSITWQTTRPIALAGLELLLSGDGEGANARAAEMIRIFVEGALVDTYDNNHDGTGNNGNALVRIFQGGPVFGDDFRIEFTHTSSPGARIQEINAILATPEPGSVAIWSLVALGFVGIAGAQWVRKNRNST